MSSMSFRLVRNLKAFPCLGQISNFLEKYFILFNHDIVSNLLWKHITILRRAIVIPRLVELFNSFLVSHLLLPWCFDRFSFLRLQESLRDIVLSILVDSQNNFRASIDEYGIFFFKRYCSVQSPRVTQTRGLRNRVVLWK